MGRCDNSRNNNILQSCKPDDTEYNLTLILLWKMVSRVQFPTLSRLGREADGVYRSAHPAFR